MKCKFLLLPLTLFLAQSALATTVLPQPKACPSITAIKTIGVNKAQYYAIDGWVGTNVNHYDTQEEWSFYIFVPRQTNDENDAIAKGNANIALLSAVHGPDGKDNEWRCYYLNEQQKPLGMAMLR